MAYLRRLPSGKWQATVRLGKKRCSKSDWLFGVVDAWAKQLEGDARRGDALDPRRGKLTVGELWDQASDARRLELASRRRDESHWRHHAEPQWGSVPAQTIRRADVRRWVTQMEQAKVGAWTVRAAVGVLRAVLEYAVEERVIRTNPARGVRQPPPPQHLDRVLEADEDELLLAALDELAGGRPHGRLLAELMLYCGCRWEDAAAVRRERVERRRKVIILGPVVERDGTIRETDKAGGSGQPVPVPDHLWGRLWDRARATDLGGLIITAPRGGVLLYPTWRARVFEPAVELAGIGKVTPHDLRHTYATRLADAGVPVHDIMALLRQRSIRSVQRYLHASEGRFDRARRAVEKGRSVQDGRASAERHRPERDVRSSQVESDESAAQGHDHKEAAGQAAA